MLNNAGLNPKDVFCRLFETRRRQRLQQLEAELPWKGMNIEEICAALGSSVSTMRIEKRVS
jgi:hypothetical protein